MKTKIASVQNKKKKKKEGFIYNRYYFTEPVHLFPS